MHIVYHCFGGTHSSVIAAALHTGLLYEKRPPDEKSSFTLPYFDTQDGRDRGKLYFYGIDECGNRVYIIGRGRDTEALQLVFGEQIENGLRAVIVNTLPCFPFILKVGGFISRRLKRPRLGRPLVFAGIRRGYPFVKDLVYQVKTEVREE
ncbi:MAG: DUF3189 family protein [Bacillota bacterium]